MKKNIILLSLPLAILLAACSNSKNKIAHKWRVSHTGWYQSTMSDSAEFATQEQAAKELYLNKIYDLKSDGTFTTSGGLEQTKGTWDIIDNVVSLTPEKGQPERWFYLSDKVEIMADSSMTVKLNSGNDQYVMLVLKPAPGERVNTDY